MVPASTTLLQEVENKLSLSIQDEDADDRGRSLKSDVLCTEEGDEDVLHSDWLVVVEVELIEDSKRLCVCRPHDVTEQHLLSNRFLSDADVQERRDGAAENHEGDAGGRTRSSHVQQVVHPSLILHQCRSGSWSC